MKFLENKRLRSHYGSSKTHDMVLCTGGTQPVCSPLKMVRTALSASQTLLLEELLFLISHIHFSLAILIVGLELINDLAF